jgi:hypothetical protein
VEVLINRVDDDQVTITIHPDRETEYEIFLRRTPECKDGTMTKKYALSVFETGELGKLTVVSTPE